MILSLATLISISAPLFARVTSLEQLSLAEFSGSVNLESNSWYSQFFKKTNEKRGKIILRACLRDPNHQNIWWSPNIFLTKFCLLLVLTEKFFVDWPIRNLFSQQKVNIKKWQLIFRYKNIWWSTKFWWFGCHEWVITLFRKFWKTSIVKFKRWPIQLFFSQF